MVLAGLLLLSGLALGAGAHRDPVSDPEDRAVRIETAGCPPAPPSTSSGVLVAPGVALTVAHGVIAAAGIDVLEASGSQWTGEALAIDAGRDLALVVRRSGAARSGHRREPIRGPLEVTIGPEPAQGAALRIVGGARSGTLAATLERSADLDVQAVRAPSRARRRGLALAAATLPGDSGAGVYDARDRLVGLLFASSVDVEDRSWAVAAGELSAFLADPSYDAARPPGSC